MYTMNRCLCRYFGPPRPQAGATKNVAARAILYWACALFALQILVFQPSSAFAQSDQALPVPEQVAKPEDFVGRQFPPNALRGRMKVLQGVEVLIDGKPERLSPGARIRGPQNALVMTGAITGDEYTVNFVRDAYNNVHQVWILTALEARQKIKSATPYSNIIFGSDADKPKVDDGKTPFDQLPKYKQ
jgi:hypothetical protein